ncbi:OmpH family outer membrane protein [Thiorhodospira sibirica]|uniref:OmpH family outer membrane protein n=1 Tax=Thiorhodospira sibirica TaxID=154347 RepID=UPI000592FF6D
MFVFGMMTTAHAQSKIAFVNITQVMEESPQADAALRALEREFSARDNALVAERDALRQLQERLERDADVMAADRRAEMERNLRNRTREFKRSQEIFNEDLNLRRNEELAKLQRTVNSVIVEIAQKEGFDVVLTERNVLFASERINITLRVLERLQQQMPAPRR